VFTIIENGDDRSASVNLGANTFNFYGTSYTGPGQLHVSSNGLVTFGTPFTAFTNTDLSETPLERAIAPLWDDWLKNSPLTGMVLGRFDGDRLIIEWNEVQHFPTDPLLGTVTFQLILQLNTGSTPSAMWFNYVDLDMGEPAYDKAASATVGIKDLNAQGSRRLVAQFNSTEGWAATGNAIRVAVPPQSGPGRGAGDNGAAVLASLGAVEQRIETTVPATLSRSALEQTFAAERTPASPQAVAQLFATMAEKEVSRGAGSSTLFELDLKAL
jgi:hypothetical protein